MNQRGMALAEVLVVGALASIAVVFAITLTIWLTDSYIQQDSRVSASTEMEYLATRLTSDLHNSLKIDPPEDLVTSLDAAYPGVAGATNLPTSCTFALNPDNSEASSIFRYTTLRPRTVGEEVLRAWNDSSAGLTGAGNQLRLAFTNSPTHPFQSGSTSEKELILIDADHKYVRRFKINSWNHVTTNLDPFDDQPKNVNGAPTTFNYTAVYLGKPLDLAGNPVPILNKWFITHSTAFISETHTLCISDGKLTDFDESQGLATVVFDPIAQHLQILRYAIQYGAVGKNERVDPSTFKPYSQLTSAQIPCLNTLTLNFELIPSTGSAAPFKLSRLIFLPNHNSHLPVSCP